MGHHDEPSKADALGLAQADLTERVAAAMQGASRAYAAAVVRRLAELGFEGLTPASAALLARLPADGAQTVTLAREARRTKQATGKVVAELEARGYAERVRDPSDGRAQLVRPTERGRGALRAGVGVKAALAERAASIIGSDRMQRLHRDLAKLEDVFGAANEGRLE